MKPSLLLILTVILFGCSTSKPAVHKPSKPDYLIVTYTQQLSDSLWDIYAKRRWMLYKAELSRDFSPGDTIWAEYCNHKTDSTFRRIR